MAAALGVKFLDEAGNSVPLNGAGLARLRRIDSSGKDPRITHCQVLVACDVDNPLYGENGAAYVFAPQKGADPEMVEYLDQGLRNYAAVLRKDLGLDVQSNSRAGAAGGLGAGLVAFTLLNLDRALKLSWRRSISVRLLPVLI